jgi:hypothetical protein
MNYNLFSDAVCKKKTGISWVLSKSYKPSRRFITDILSPRTRSVRGQYISYKPTFEVYN